METEELLRQFPPLRCGLYDLTIQWQQGSPFVYDIWRKKFIKLTPEEWVRQNFLHFAVNEKHFPSTRLHLEYEIQIYGRKKRIDCLVYDEYFTPLVLIECKAPTVAITQRAMQQIGSYNMNLKVPHLIMTNGDTVVYSQTINHIQQYSDELPDYITLQR